MKQKRVYLLLVLVLLFSLFFSLLLFSSVSAQSEEEKVGKAYNWLITQVHGHWNNLNTKQNVFSLLALQCNSTFFNKGNDSLYEKSVLVQGKRCWGTGDVSSQGQCKLTETALAKIALDEFGYETDEIAQWIISRNKTFLDIHWYLQIDIEQGQQANCSIIYQGVEEEGYKVFEDKSVGIVGSSRCFTSAGYWFKVKQTEECYNSQYTVKCWSGSSYYIVSWLYKKSPTSNIFYVSEETQSASPGYGNVEPDSIDTKLTSYCLTSPSDSANCDYEGTGWASYALAKQGYTSDANVYIPYLIVAQESNIGYFPSTFLYQLMGTAMYETKIRNEQKTGGYWLIQPIIYGRNYDTAHAAMALGVGDDASQNAKTWLLQTQSTIGFWDSQDPGKERIRDTSYLLWLFWPDLCPYGEEGITNITNVTTADCEDQGPLFTCRDTCEIDEIIVPLFNCTGTDICCKQVGGVPVGDECDLEGGTCRDDCYGDEFELLGIDCTGVDICCKPYIDLTCNEVGGEFCMSGMMCDPPSSEVETADSLPLSMCCLGDCIAGLTCEAQNGYICNPTYGQYCPAGMELSASNTQYCCENSCQSASMMSCYDLGGELCYSGQICLDWYDIQQNFVTASDGNCCIDGYCAEEEYCSAIGGQECFYPQQCKENAYVTTIDVDECCTSECVAYCEDLGGVYCYDQECKGGTTTESLEGYNCCVGGTCGEAGGGGFPWWIFIIIIIVAGGIAAYFLYFKKPRKPKAKGFPFGPRPGGPGGKLPIIAKRPLMRPGRPGAPGMQRPMMARPGPGRPGMPQRPVLKKPGVMMPSVPRPVEKKPVGAPPQIMKKIERPSPLVSKPTVPGKAKIKAKRRAKSKTEDELEKTLKKLRKITKAKAKKASKARKKK